MSNKRLKILSKSEINDLYSIPTFSNHEQQSYFSLNEKEHEIMRTRGSLTSKVHFILQLGYFKATSQFFNCTFNEVEHDVTFILLEYFNNATLQADQVSENTRLSNQALIADELDYMIDKAIIKNKLSKILETKIKFCNNPIYLFHELLCFSNQNRLMMLGYTTLQDLIGAAITNEEHRLSSSLKKYLNKKDWKSIENIISQGSNEYLLTALKKDPKGFNYKHIKAEIKKLEANREIYRSAKKIFPKVKISHKNIAYYASLAERRPINDLKKLSKTKQAIYIICYVYHRYQKINDNLVVTHFHYVSKFNDEAGSKARDQIFKEKIELDKDSKHAGSVLRLFDDESIPDRESFGSVRKRAYKYIKKGRFSVVSDYLEGLLHDYQKVKWDELSKLKHKITKNIRPIFRALDFSGDANQKSLLSAIKFLKDYFAAPPLTKKKLIKKSPISCIPKPWRQYLATPDESDNSRGNVIDIVKYEFMIYQCILAQIETGHLYLSDSINFKSLAAHLVSDEQWKKKTSLLRKVGNKKLLTPINMILDQTERELELLICTVNENINNGVNKDIKIKNNEDEITFTLPYPASADRENHPIFKQLTQISIANVLQFAQDDCNFMKAFTHIKPYESKEILDPTAIRACIIANATNLGIHKMSESSDLSYQRMQSQMKNFIRLETLQEANDMLSNAIAKLSIFKYWNIHGDCIHGSVDGQKFETRLHSFIARYSSKYFGVNKGVVAYTLCANHIPVNAKIISANHHESHFLFDILFNNSSDVDINWLSGDGHSVNQINFALLDFIDKQFAPQFKRINKKVNALYAFKDLNYYKDSLIKPKHKINKKLIMKEWDNIQRIIASLLLGETSQHIIVSKLSSHKRKNQTKEALWEYDKILMSIYMLNFINDAAIRRNVRRSLNRGEAYHQLRRAIANVHGRKFRGSSDRELELWNECARLMANCMIYYNAKLLDALLLRLQKEGNEDMIEQLKYISPAAWRHINLYGHYAFEENQVMTINMNNIAKTINVLKMD